MKIMSTIRNKRFLRNFFSGHMADERGITFIELIISMAVTAVISASLYGVYAAFFKQVNIQDQVQETLQNARAGISFMERELVNAGLDSVEAEPLTEATAVSIEFVYRDPDDDDISLTGGEKIRVKYGLETIGGVQYLYRSVAVCADPTCTAISGDNEPIISNVSGLDITYFDIDGTTIATPITDSDIRATVRFATIELKTITEDILPGMETAKEFTVKTHVRIRNLGIGKTASDSAPPDPPLSVLVRDPRKCSSLDVRWDKEITGSGVAGYKIFYGTTSGTYNGVVDVPFNNFPSNCSSTSSTITCTISPVTPEDPDVYVLEHSPSSGAATNTYYIIVKAYDNVFNNSSASAEAFGNPSGSNSDFSGGDQDSTINPVKPGAITNFIGADGASDKQVSLSWDAYDTSTYSDVEGMRLYRSTSPMTTYPIVADGTDIIWVAGEPGTTRPGGDIAVGDTSYTDISASLAGCQLYYYAIAPANCDDTLITDDDPSEDGDNTKYVEADYSLTSGDGVDGSADDTPTGADTSPGETVAPPLATFGVRAGWKRVNVSFIQPDVDDIARTCIYVNEGATPPALHTDTDLYPLTNGCLQINTTDTPSAQFVPDSGGSFTVAEVGQGVGKRFYHNSMTSAWPPTPELLEDGVFSYSYVSVDQCGNTSPTDTATAMSVLCGEDPPIIGYWSNTFNHPKPPAVTLPSVDLCSSTATLSWTPVPSDPNFYSTPVNPYDLAGYRILRSTEPDFLSGNSMRTPGAPWWPSTFGDGGLTDGSVYYYRIISTDCVYEARGLSDWDVISNANWNYVHSIDLPAAYPGRIGRDEKCEGAGSCIQDNHREVLTGVDMDNSLGSGDNSSTPQTSFNHDKVTLFFENTSGSTFTIQSLSTYWVNTEAHLSNVKIGGGRGGLGEISTAIDISDTQTVSLSTPQVRAVLARDITDVQIPAGARYVPIELTYTDSAGDPIDMRDDKLLFELNIQNDSTSTTSCESNLTISEVLENVAVPFGPSVSATQQDRPISPTFGYAVPGSSGLNSVPSGTDASILVVGNITVNIHALVKSNTTDGESGGKVALGTPVLNYIVTARTVTEAPTSGYTAQAMTDTGGGIYKGSIPPNDGKRIWYYILATDADGNFDRDPEIDAGAYVYDQDTYVFDVCDLTPNAPTNLTAMDNGLDADLEWTAPTLYTDGSNLDVGLDPIVYYIYRDGAIFDKVAHPTLTYTDVDPANPLTSGVFNYNVTVQNSCLVPGPNESAQSNTSATCVGASGLGIMSVDNTSILAGESFTVTVTDCNALDPPNDTTIEELNAGTFAIFAVESTWPETIKPTGILETGAATGQFEVTINTTDDVDVSTPTPLIHTLTTGNDDITVSYSWAGNSPITIDVTPDPCASTPSVPTGFSGAMAGVGSNETVTLSWSEVTTNDDLSTIDDLVGYYVYEKVCGKSDPDCAAADAVADWFLRAVIAADPTPETPALNADNGNFNNRIYYFKVTAYDSCGTPNESVDSSEWNDPS